MAKSKDLKGLKFGRLTPIKIVGKEYRTSIWECKCECGKLINVPISRLKNGETKSCGCLREEFYENKLNEQIKKYQVDGTNIAYFKSEKLSKANTSGVRGITKSKNGKWRAQIVFRRKGYNLGTYENKEDAIKARKKEEEEIKEFLKIK